MSYIGKRIERRGLSVKEEERREKRGKLVILKILELKKERREIREKEGGVLERKSLRREGFRLGELNF